MNKTFKVAVALTVTLVIAAGCKKKPDETRTEAPPADSAIQISPANMTVLVQEEIRSGPIISGALMPRREATIRAEVGGSVLQTYADKGQAVPRGAPLARIDDSAVRESYLSAKSAVTSAESGAQLARRNLERAQKLAQAGAISERDLEQARWNATNAEAQLADAGARFSAAQKQLARTQVRAPFAGVISDRPVNAGDVVAPGALLFTMMDPAGGMKFEASVAANQLGGLRVGAPVQFRVHGYPGRIFTGHVERINPSADPSTGQIALYVAVLNAGGLVSGLYAEGRVGSQAKQALTAPTNAITMSGDTSFIMRVRQGRVEKVPVQVGVRDDEMERVEIIGQVAAGDTILIGAAASISPNSLVRVQAITDQPALR
jgi:membrane fusion protein, multidrug efflux system